MPRKPMKYNALTGRYEYVNEPPQVARPINPADFLTRTPVGGWQYTEVNPFLVGLGGTPVPEKPKPVAKPNGRQVNVRLGDLMNVYNNPEVKLVDFRIPQLGDWILTKNPHPDGMRLNKCTMRGIREPRLIFEVVVG